MKFIFDTRNIYYLPQYLPIYRELIKRNHTASFVCYRSTDDQTKVAPLFEKLGLPTNWFDDRNQALEYYISQKADWVFFW